ncbi:unnamed protein product [Sphagnum balticum]
MSPLIILQKRQSVMVLSLLLTRVEISGSSDGASARGASDGSYPSDLLPRYNPGRVRSSHIAHSGPASRHHLRGGQGPIPHRLLSLLRQHKALHKVRDQHNNSQAVGRNKRGRVRSRGRRHQHRCLPQRGRRGYYWLTTGIESGFG